MEDKSRDRLRSLFLLFKEAIEGEREAQEMYSRAMALADNPEIRGLLATLIAEEGRHEESLIAEYGRMRTLLGLDQDPRSAPPAWHKVQP